MRVVLRVVGYVVGFLLLVVLLLVAYIYGASSLRFNKTYSVTVAPITVSSDPATIERGHHLATAINKCIDCHGQNLGGAVFLDVPPGRVIAPNLTSGKGGIGATMKDEDWVRAIRYGIGPNGHALKIMPSEDFYGMSDADMGALVSYVKSVPPVDNDPGPTTVRFLGRVLFIAGQLPLFAAERLPLDTPPPAAPAAGVTPEYGKYLANIGGCTGCHGPGLSGGKIAGTGPDTPPAANLTPSGRLAQWSDADFTHLLRTGMRPDGSPVDPFMPWKDTKLMTDDEIAALLQYIRTVPARTPGTH